MRAPTLANVPSLLLLLALLALGGPAQGADPDPRPFEEQPYLGLSVRDGPGGTLVVGWVLPGPLGGQGSESSSGIKRDDNVVSLDGESRDAAGFKAHLVTKKPGDEVTLVVRRSPEANPDKAVPTGGVGGEERTLKVVLAKRSEWAGTIGRGRARPAEFPAPEEGAYEAEILAQAAALGLRAGDEGVGGGLDALLARLKTVQEDALDLNSLPWVVNAFRRPLSLDRLEAQVAERVLRMAQPTRAEVLRGLQHLLALPVWHVRGLFGQEQRAFSRKAWDERQPAVLGPMLARLLRTLRDDVTPFGPHAEEHIRLIGVGQGPVALNQLCTQVYYTAGWAAQLARDWQWPTKPDLPHLGPSTSPPPLPAGAVEGEVLWVGEDLFGRPMVVGGSTPNHYDMSRLGAVLDIGGDDVYTFGGEEFVPQTVIKDLAGNDLYESTTDFQGPATSVLGVSWLEDLQGNDTYRCTGQGAIAVGIGGLGVLIDHAGDDLYENRGPRAGWSMGVGYYGAGLLIDLEGSDTYRGEKLCQGVGGPLGVGLLLDVRGNDRYDADGPSFPSAYGTPGVHVGMSQGFGYGVRGYAAGGLGALYDLAGDDRYTAGEFSQAGGYYFGLGVLHDSGGNDLYHGNRYGQAFAAHQAVGILVDEAGDDTYWSMTAASQAGTWDESLGLLLDKQGDDTYRCDGLGQGSAAMQAVALLVDVAGRDHYVGHGASVQGQGGGNSYHYEADKVFSFNALLDLGGSDDVYSSGRVNNTVVRTGKLSGTVRGESDLYGLFLDR